MKREGVFDQISSNSSILEVTVKNKQTKPSEVISTAQTQRGHETTDSAPGGPCAQL